MIISRGFQLIKNASSIAKQGVKFNKVQVRNSGHAVFYREVPQASFPDRLLAELAGGLMWWWILWHMWHDWGHIVGEFPYPEPEKWTDEELGIPPDDID